MKKKRESERDRVYKARKRGDQQERETERERVISGKTNTNKKGGRNMFGH